MDKPKTVQELLKDPKHWTKREIARDDIGNGCLSRDEHAVCWCFVGAIDYVYRTRDERTAAISRIVDVLRKRGLSSHIPSFNDAPERTHAQVLELAIEAGV